MSNKIQITEVIPIQNPINSPILRKNNLNKITIYPLIQISISVNFENGEILPKDTESMDCSLAEDSTCKKYPLVALAGTKETVYSGHVGKDYPKDLMGTYIGIRNKTTNKVSTY